MFNKQEVRTIAEAIEQVAQKELGPRFLVKYKSGKYGDTATISLEVAKADETGNIKTQAEYDFINMATQVGLDPDDLGAEVQFDGVWYKVAGLRPRAWKRPIIIESIVGKKRLVVAVQSVLMAKNMGKRFWRPAS